MDKMNRATGEVRKSDMCEVKALSKPSAMTQSVMEAVMVLTGMQADWGAVKKSLSDSSSFLSKLNYFDRSLLIVDRVEKVEREYLPNVTVEEVRKQSVFAAAMVDWVASVCAVFRVEQEPRSGRFFYRFRPRTSSKYLILV